MLQILLADDHALLRMGLRDLLETRPDWQVCAEAPDGRQAALMAERLKPDVAVLDLLMPDLNGIEATRQIHRVSPATAVLILAGNYSEQIEEDSISAGAQGFIQKSNAESRVIPAIEALARRETFFPRKASTGNGASAARCRTRLPDQTVPLTSREIEIAQLLAEAKTNWCIATILGISVRTVETHRANIMQKLGLESLVELVHYAIRNRLVEP